MSMDDLIERMKYIPFKYKNIWLIAELITTQFLVQYFIGAPDI
jgi:hypothetical protein